MRIRPANLNCPAQGKGRFFSAYIIAILAAILFPVFAKAREKARQTSCLNNVKQIVTAGMTYAQDYDESLPACCYRRGPYQVDTTVLYYLKDVLVPYVKNTQLFICPSAPTISPGYAQTRGIGGPACNGTSAGVHALGNFKNPSETMFIADGAGTPGLCGWARLTACTGTWGYTPALAATVSDQIFRHNGGANVGYVDGHSKWRKAPGTTASGASDYAECTKLMHP